MTEEEKLGDSDRAKMKKPERAIYKPGQGIKPLRNTSSPRTAAAVDGDLLRRTGSANSGLEKDHQTNSAPPNNRIGSEPPVVDAVSNKRKKSNADSRPQSRHNSEPDSGSPPVNTKARMRNKRKGKGAGRFQCDDGREGTSAGTKEREAKHSNDAEGSQRRNGFDNSRQRSGQGNPRYAVGDFNNLRENHVTGNFPVRDRGVFDNRRSDNVGRYAGQRNDRFSDVSQQRHDYRMDDGFRRERGYHQSGRSQRGAFGRQSNLQAGPGSSRHEVSSHVPGNPNLGEAEREQDASFQSSAQDGKNFVGKEFINSKLMPHDRRQRRVSEQSWSGFSDDGRRGSQNPRGRGNSKFTSDIPPRFRKQLDSRRNNGREREQEPPHEIEPLVYNGYDSDVPRPRGKAESTGRTGFDIRDGRERQRVSSPPARATFSSGNVHPRRGDGSPLINAEPQKKPTPLMSIRFPGTEDVTVPPPFAIANDRGSGRQGSDRQFSRDDSAIDARHGNPMRTDNRRWQIRDDSHVNSSGQPGQSDDLLTKRGDAEEPAVYTPMPRVPNPNVSLRSSLSLVLSPRSGATSLNAPFPNRGGSTQPLRFPSPRIAALPRPQRPTSYLDEDEAADVGRGPPGSHSQPMMQQYPHPAHGQVPTAPPGRLQMPMHSPRCDEPVEPRDLLSAQSNDSVGDTPWALVVEKECSKQAVQQRLPSRAPAPAMPPGMPMPPYPVQMQPLFLPQPGSQQPIRSGGGVIRLPVQQANVLHHDMSEEEECDALVQRLFHLQQDLELHLSHFGDRIDAYEQAMGVRSEIERVCRGLILDYPDYSFRKQMDTTLWRCAFYRMIEVLRQLAPEQPAWQTRYVSFLREAFVFYQGLLDDIQTRHDFFVEPVHVELDAPNLDKLVGLRTKSENRRSNKIVSVMCQRFCNNLGDISRYHVQTTRANNFGRPRSFYLRAALLNPSNGHPYNQLALLATYTRRRLEGVYFFVRALSVRHPFEAAKQALAQMLEETHAKFNYHEENVRASYERLEREARQRAQEVTAGSPRIHARGKGNRYMRDEVWVLPTGVEKKVRIDEDLEAQVPSKAELLTQCDAPELHRRLTIYYLEMVRVMFTGISAESLPSVAEKALLQLRTLLARPSPLTAVQLVQMMAVLIYCVSKHLHDWSSDALSLPMMSLRILSTTAALLLERVRMDLSQESGDGLSEPSLILLPALRVWSTYMQYQQQIGCQLAEARSISPKHLEVELLPELLTVCNQASQLGIRVADSASDNCASEPENEQHGAGLGQKWHLPEDVILWDFNEFFDAPKPVNPNVPLFEHRLKWLLELALILEDPLKLRYHETDGVIVYSLPDLGRDEPEIAKPQERRGSESSSSSEESAAESASGDEQVSEEMSRLRLLRRDQRSRQAALASERRCRPRMTVHPSYIIADTNTWIDHLELIEQLTAGLPDLILVVPIMVKRELDGLSKPKQGEEWTSERAAKALAWLEEKFAAGGTAIRAVTTEGNLIRGMAYQQEEPAGAGETMDDKILLCCRRLSDNISGADKPNSKELTRKVALLTEDKTMRVKAVSQGIATTSVVNFANWCSR